ncbi:hypothetical protein SLS62_002257 [Diatrype stigma]|uniref:Integral membrane protein n=1 Tax=Diatrype stigma TaxID=117547 RepID=A0AAN9UYW3_9PEZI
MTSSTLRRAHNSQPKPRWDEPVPPILRPLFRAYVLGYASSVGPRVVTLVLQHLQVATRRKKRGDPKPNVNVSVAAPHKPFLQSLRRILQCGFDLRRFPAFCAALMGGTTLLEVRMTCRLTDPAIFAASSALIMWAWFYHPSQLPRAYHKWISSAAAVDPRLIEALQRCRRGELRYGHSGSGSGSGSKDKLLQSMCADYRWPLDWGDPAKAIPFPCEMVHMGCGPSCEYHALSRFARTFQWAMATYLPLNLLILTKRRDLRAVAVALRNAARSSAFLGAFVALFYYGVCLARTRVGPRVLGLGSRDDDHDEEVQTRQHIDSGICVGAGCLLCGWSILLEKPGRAANMALFVAPRALATRLPRRYPRRLQGRETMAFALSAAAVLTCARENPRRVRGVLGKILELVLS